MAATTLESDRSGTQSLRRVLRHYVRKSRKALKSDPPNDQAIHEARKALNKSRAAMRLLRSGLGEGRYRRTNRVLRNSVHSLNELRDALVITQTLSGLRRSRPLLRHNRAAVRLAAEFEQELAQAHQRLLASPQTLRVQCQFLRRIEHRARDWSLGRHGWSVIGPSLCRMYRKGRRVPPAASEHPPDASLHEWRRQIKYLRYALRMLAPLQPRKLGAFEKRADRLVAQLGDAHDLAVLQARARRLQPEDFPGVSELIEQIEQARIQHAREALVAGKQLFRARPRAFERELAHAWRRWRRDHG